MVRLAVTLMGKGRESILPALVFHQRRSLVPLWASPVVRVKGRPLFTRPMAVWHHLKRLHRYNSERWAQQHQSRVAKRRHNRRSTQGKTADAQNNNVHQRVRCPGKGGAKKAAGAGVCQRLLCRASPARRGAQRRAMQSGETQWRRNNTCAMGRGRVLHTTPAVRQGRAPGNSAAAPAAVVLRCTQLRTMLHMRGVGQVGAALLRHAPHMITPPTGTAWDTGQSECGGAAHPGRGGGLS